MSDDTPLRIDRQRLWDSLMAMAEIGGTAKGGCNRQALTDVDKAGRDLFREWAEAAGCEIKLDEMGNMMAWRAGRSDTLPPVVIGSHLDTQPTGGKFDGVLGVLAGLEVIRTLNDLGVTTDHPLMLINWTNEEGCRFAPVMMSSGVWAGVFSRDWAYERLDREGRNFRGELERIGYRGDEPCQPRPWKCHLELHIEQGPILETEGCEIGVVRGGQGANWYDVLITGHSSHAGSTPMTRRKDALVGAARAIARFDEIARAYAPHAVITVGEIQVASSSRNVVPGNVRFSVDMRHPDPGTIDRLDQDIRAAVAAACAPNQLDSEIEFVSSFPPVQFHADCIEAIREAAATLGYSHRDIISGAGHDSCYVARQVPTGMIFIPCRDGLSHNEAESIEPAQAEQGCNVLLNTALALASAAATSPEIRRE